MIAEWTDMWANDLANSSIKCFECSCNGYEDSDEDERKMLEQVQRLIEKWGENKRYYFFASGSEHLPLSLLSKRVELFEFWKKRKGLKMIRSTEADQMISRGIHTYGVCEVTEEFIKSDIRNKLFQGLGRYSLLMTEEDRPLEELMAYFGEDFKVLKRIEINPFKLADAECEKGGIVVMAHDTEDDGYGFSFFMKGDNS